MKVLMISTDRKMFDRESAVHARMLSYAQEFDELHIVVFAKKSLGFAEEKCGEKLFVYPTQSFGKIGYIFDAISIGRSLLSRSSKLEAGSWIVSTQDPFETGLVGVRLSRLFHTKLQIQIHTDFLSPYFKRGGVSNIFRRVIGEYIVLFADRIRVVSLRIQQGLTERLHISSDKIDVVPIGVDAKSSARNTTSGLLQTQYPQFVQTVLVTSRLEKEKNISWVVASWTKVRAHFPKVGLVIVGEGSLKIRLQEQVVKLGLGESIVFVPWQKDLSPYFASATAFLSTSWYEGYGMTLVESAQAKCPIVTTDVGLIGDVLPKDSVVMIDSEITDSLVDGVTGILTDLVAAKARAEVAFTAVTSATVNNISSTISIKKTATSIGVQPSLIASCLKLLHADSMFGMLVKYLLSGGTAAIVDLGALYVFTDIFDIWYVYSSAIAFLIAFGVSFLMQKFWTFRDHNTDGVHKQVFFYLAVSVFNLFLNTGLVYGFVEFGGIHYLPAQIITSAFIACESFFVYKFIIFARK